MEGVRTKGKRANGEGEEMLHIRGELSKKAGGGWEKIF